MTGVIALILALAADSVSLPVVWDRAFNLETSIRQAVRKDDGDWVSTSETWRVAVQPTNDGFKTRWTSRTSPDVTPMLVETDPRLVPTAVTNLEDVWRERGRELVVFTQVSEDAAAQMVRTLPEPARFSLIARPLTLLSFGQGLELVVGEPLTQSLESISVGDAQVAMVSTFLLRSVDEGRGKAIVEWTTDLEPKSLEEAFPSMVRALLGVSEDDADKLAEFNRALESAQMVQRRQCEYVIDMVSGIADHVECTEIQSVAFLDHRTKTEKRLEATQALLP